MKHKRFGLADVSSSDRGEIQWISQSEGLEGLSMSLMWPSILQVVESSVEIVCVSLEDTMRPSEIMIFNVSFK